MRRLVLAAVLSIGLLLSLSSCVASGTIRVPEDYPTIESAVSNGSSGDEIVVADGTWYGDPETDNILVSEKDSLTIRSASGNPAACIVQARFHVVWSPQFTLQDVTVTGGNAGSLNGGGVYLHESPATISHCIIAANSADTGGAIHCNQLSPTTVANCSIYGNVADVGGTIVSASPISVLDCTIYGNSIPAISHSFSPNDSGEVLIQGCLIYGNGQDSGRLQEEADYDYGAIDNNSGTATCSLVTISDCTIADNASCGISNNCNDIDIENSIIAFNSGPSLSCYWWEATISLICTDIYGNLGGDWIAIIQDQEQMNGNMHLNPFFCNSSAGDYSLAPASPCLSDPSCGQIGSEGAGTGCVCQADFIYQQTLYDPPTMSFQGYASQVGVTWSWDFGDSTGSSTQNPVHEYSVSPCETDSFLVKLQVSGTSGQCDYAQLVPVEHWPNCNYAEFRYDQPTIEVPVVEFQDSLPGSLGSTSLWDFGDGDSSSAADPSHTYDIEPCRNDSFWVYHTVDVGDCHHNSNKQIAVSWFPALGSRGKAYVIIGDVEDTKHTNPDYPSLEGAAKAATERLEKMGYNVTRFGTADPLAPATKAEFEQAARDTAARAFVVIAHGIRANQVSSYGAHYVMGDSLVGPVDLSSWRAGGPLLDEVSLYICNAGLDTNLARDWGVTAIPLSYSNIVATTEPKAREHDRKCDQSPEFLRRTHMQPARLASWHSRPPFTLCMADSVTSCDEYYGSIGSFSTREYFNSGYLAYEDTSLGVAFEFTGSAGSDSVDLWAIKYSGSPCDRIPAGTELVHSYLVGTSEVEACGTLELAYDESLVDSLRAGGEEFVRLYVFSAEEDTLLQVDDEDTVVDTAANVLRIPEYCGGAYLTLLVVDLLASVPMNGRSQVKMMCAPNPSERMIEIEYQIAEPGHVNISVYDNLGRKVAVVLDRSMGVGRHVVVWDNRDTTGQEVSPGIYFVRLRTSGRIATQKVIVVR